LGVWCPYGNNFFGCAVPGAACPVWQFVTLFMQGGIYVESCDLVFYTDSGLEGSEEFNLGMRELRRRLSIVRRWYMVSGETVPDPADFPLWSDAPFVLVILCPALFISDNLLEELIAAVSCGDDTCCVLPADPRGFNAGVTLDYVVRSGFDRFVSRLATGPRQISFDGREPWLYLTTRQALAGLVSSRVSWQALPAFLGNRTAIAGHAFIHSYADYYCYSRAEMLPLLPDTVSTLLDIGGGVGNFSALFMRERGGQATLLELNPGMAAVARQKGLDVLEGDFRNVILPDRYDCVAFLDVLEHLIDPLDALIKARQALKPGGFLLLSVPNVGHWSVVKDLLEGDFNYLPVGILCNTHLRFFTRSGLQTMLTDAGFCVERWDNSTMPLPEAFVKYLQAAVTAAVIPDLESLATESFHVLARCYGETTQKW
jgi:SAM-dependent methyltransferase